MWRLAKPTSRGGNSVRSVFTVVIAAFLAVLFVTILFNAPAAHAADASWNGGTITYQSDVYNGPVAASTVKQLGLFDGVQAYTYVEPSSNTTNPASGSSSSSNSPPRKIYVIYFAKDVDVSTATKAQYRSYDYINKTTFTNGTNPVDITIDAQNAASNAGTSACEVDGGVGWWICPITNFLAWGTDQVFSVLSDFLAVQPPQTNQDNALYRAWTYMRSIANVAFVIVFLIIIYSQITNLGLDNYGIKKLMPRLIVAALLVNLSYFVAAIAIDVSNIIGYSIQDIFLGMRNTLVGPEGNGYDITTISWENIAGFILSGGTAAVAGSIGGFIVLADFGITGSLILLLPAVVSALLALLVAVVIMAARQAIIIILVIISPLAFVAYLLPNTEKWFEKWRETFMTMLILFPAFSLVFGGSQLAGTAIIQNADNINLVILGMMVQVAPLFITPLLLRLGGDILRQVGDAMNKPRQALQSRVDDWSKDRANNIKERRLGDLDNPKRQPLRRAAHWRDGRRRNREELAKTAGAEADARWANDRRFREANQRALRAGDIKHYGEKASELQYANSKFVPDSQKANTLTRNQTAGLRLNQVEEALEHSEAKLKMQYSRLRLDEKDSKRTMSKALGHYAQVAREHYIESQDLARQVSIIEEGLQGQYAASLDARLSEKNKDPVLREAMQAQFNLVNKNGYRSALASAKAVIDEQVNRQIKEIEATNGIEAGDVVKLSNALKQSRIDGDLAGVVAFTNILGRSQNAGIAELRRTIIQLEEGLRGGTESEQTLLSDWKQYINANDQLNTYAEDIVSWSRPEPANKDQLLKERFLDQKTWADLTLQQWASQKSSTQFASMAAGGYMTPQRAQEILSDGDLKNALKQKVVRQLEYYAAGYDPETKRTDPDWREPIFREDGRPGNPTSIDELNEEWRNNLYDFNHKDGGATDEDSE